MTNEAIERIRTEAGKHCPCCHSTEIWSQYNDAEARDLLLDFVRRLSMTTVNSGVGGLTASEIGALPSAEEVARVLKHKIRTFAALKDADRIDIVCDFMDEVARRFPSGCSPEEAADFILSIRGVRVGASFGQP
jgi:hypothetical protein